MKPEQLQILLARQKAWSLPTFGPGEKTQARVNHIRKELKEIEENPEDPIEYVDCAILAMDAIWRIGSSIEEILTIEPGEFYFNKSICRLYIIPSRLEKLLTTNSSYLRFQTWRTIFYSILNELRDMFYSDDEIFWMIYAKQIINFHRKWPAPVGEDIMIEHIRTEE